MARPSKKDKNLDFDISQIIGNIRQEVYSNDESFIPDIMTFVRSPRYLNFDDLGITLYPMQAIILKCFYRGTVGNEKIALTDEEMALLRRTGQEQVIEKYNSGAEFRELVLVLGRRSGKDFLTAIIALYESMKLLELPGGCPLKYYKLAEGQPIHILTVATASDQAKILFSEMKVKMQNSPYFHNKVGHMESDKIWLLTPSDKKNIRNLLDNGMKQMAESIKGSIVVMSGHSNSDSLLGKRTYAILLDEVASYKSTGGSASDSRIYAALGPMQADFSRTIGIDDDGDPIKVLDSKIISISSPRGESGKLYQLYKSAGEVEQRLAFRLPTWEVNLGITQKLLRKEFSDMSTVDFAMEYGAQFAGTAGERFISDIYVDRCFELGADWQEPVVGRPGVGYYAHLDPASTSHNYALIVLHIEDRYRVKEDMNGVMRKEKVKYFIVDHIKTWKPDVNKAISVFEVDEYVINLARRFKFTMVSYDDWNSLASVEKLRSKHIPTKITSFRAKYKAKIYQHLEHIMVNEQLVFPGKHRSEDSHLLEGELKCLKRVFTPNSFKIKPDEEAMIKTDDLCFKGGTLVLMADKKYKRIDEINKGDFVISADGTTQEVVETSQHQTNEDLYKLQTFYGFPVYITGNHPVQTDNGEYKPVKDLTMQDRIRLTIQERSEGENYIYDMSDYVKEEASPYCNVKWCCKDKVRSQNANGKWHNRTIKLDEKLALLVGLYLSEGSCGHHSVGFSYSRDEVDLHEKTSDLVEDLFGIDTTRCDSDLLNTSTIIVNSQILKSFFRSLIGSDRAPNKQIPSSFMHASVDIQKELLRGLFLGDGMYDEKNIVFTTTSECMANQIRWILLRMGISSSISISKRKGKKVCIQGREVKYNADLYCIRTAWYEHYNMLSDMFGIGLYKEKSKYHKLRCNFNTLHRQNDIGINLDVHTIDFDIRKIENLGSTSELVYNLQVKNDHTYITQFNVHNCDALAGACGTAVERIYTGFPKSGTAYLPQAQDMQNTWNIGHGSFNTQQYNHFHRKFGI